MARDPGRLLADAAWPEAPATLPSPTPLDELALEHWVMRFMSDALTADTSRPDRRVAAGLPP